MRHIKKVSLAILIRWMQYLTMAKEWAGFATSTSLARKRKLTLFEKEFQLSLIICRGFDVMKVSLPKFCVINHFSTWCRLLVTNKQHKNFTGWWRMTLWMRLRKTLYNELRFIRFFLHEIHRKIVSSLFATRTCNAKQTWLEANIAEPLFLAFECWFASPF